MHIVSDTVIFCILYYYFFKLFPSQKFSSLSSKKPPRCQQLLNKNPRVCAVLDHVAGYGDAEVLGFAAVV
ncbi:hypothetical protein D3C73_1227520 [compost metagenome]